MALGDHLRRNWVEYLLVGGIIYFLGKNKKAKKIVEKISKKARGNLKKLLDEETPSTEPAKPKRAKPKGK